MLAVITHTRGRATLEAACASVRPALGANIKHHVLDGNCDFSEYQRRRFDVFKLADHVCFLDDDDTLDAEVLIQAYEQAVKTQLGLVFTHERIVKPTQVVIQEHRGRRYVDFERTPMACHHLAVIRSDLVHEGCLELAQEVNAGIDWFTKASAGLKGGAAILPKVGYTWNWHPNQLTKEKHTRDAHFRHHRRMMSIIRSFSGHTGLVPVLS